MLRKTETSTGQSSGRDLFTIQEAADFLGVHVATVRRWAYAKHLPGAKVGIRGDWRFALQDLVKMNVSNTDEVIANSMVVEDRKPLSHWKDLKEASHFVQFYEDEAFLLNSIQEYVETADAVIVVASQDHIDKIKSQIAQDKISVKPGSEHIFLDAKKTLASISRDGMPDKELFDQVIGKVIRDVTKRHKYVRAFGEMVAMLWSAGNKEGAILLEQLWNDLQTHYTFTLCCAYPIKDVGGSSSTGAFADICTKHSYVLPTESYSKLTSAGDRFREIAALQQKAFSLEAEVAERQRTENKLLLAVDALKASEEFNRRIIENSADCIKVLNPDGTLIQMNQPGCRLFEIDSIESILGKPYSDFWKNGHYEECLAAIRTAKAGGVGRFQGYCPTAKGTPKWWDVVITPMYDNVGQIDRLLAISRDITSLKELEQRKEDFLSTTSHELKTPLTSQKAFVQLLERQMKNKQDFTYLKFVKKIDEQTNKLTKLVTDLLDVTKIQGGKLLMTMTDVDLEACVKEAVEEIQAVSAHTITLKGHLKQKIKGDREKLSQVIFNLLTNAVKYSPKSKTIEVVLEQQRHEVIVSVKDAGIGIDKKDQARIFDRFYRVSDTNEKTYPGMGMGLFIAAEIVKRHGGTVDVESAKGHGSTFSVRLPF